MLLAVEVLDRSPILYTANGTRALLASPREATVMAAALVNAAATADWILSHRSGATVRLVITDDAAPEDPACAGHIAALLRREAVDVTAVADAVLASEEAHARLWGAHVTQDYWRDFADDVAICAQVGSSPMALIGVHDVRDRCVRLEPASDAAPLP